MTTPTDAPPIFDGHNDALLDVLLPERGGGRSFLHPSQRGHLDLPRARAGGMVGGLFACFVPNPPDGPKPVSGEPRPPIDQRYAIGMVDRMIELMQRIERESAGACRQARTVGEVREHMRSGALSMVLHFEGAEPIDPHLDNLRHYYDRGLRSIGVVWSRPNAFGHGVPFRFPSSPDVGEGLTDAGKRLVRACDELGIVIDLAHINQRGFDDVAALSTQPLVVSHAAAHALCPTSRNLTDAQIDAVGASGGIIGVVFGRCFLMPDGSEDESVPMSRIADHIAYIAGRIGVDHVGLGSDFDGVSIPCDLGDAAGLPKLVALLRQRGFDDAAVRRIGCENWLRVLEHTWKPGATSTKAAGANSR